MKITCTSAELLAHLQTVSRVASTRSAVQALSGVQIAVQEDAVELRATDMEMGLRVPLPATVVRPGSAVVPARLTLDVVRALPAADVSIELRPTDQDVEIKSGSATFHIRTLRSEDFPVTASLKIKRNVLAEELRKRPRGEAVQALAQ